MNLLFCAAPKDAYALVTTKAYPTTFAPFPPLILDVPDFSTCRDENKCATVRAKHTLNKKTSADIIPMNIALTDIFLDCLSSQVHTSFQQRCLNQPNIVFVEMFIWFVHHYCKTASKDRKANCQRMAANWHLVDGFDILVLRLFSGTVFTGCTGFLMNDCDIVNIGLHLIKRCGMYGEDYKAWFACKAIRPKIVETLDTFKMFWAVTITLVNQTAIPASLHSNRMAAINDDDTSIALYGKSITNFGATYAATQESTKSQGLTIVSLQGQVNAMQQYCMSLQQQPPPTNYAVQQQCGPNNSRGLSQCNGGYGRGGTGYQQPRQQPTMKCGLPCAH